MMDFIKLSVEDFTEALRSKAPVPGGGGSSALVAALGAALGGMVVALTVGKPKYTDVEDKMIQIGEQLKRLQFELLSLIQEDAKAFEPLSKAYGLPARTDQEITEKQRIMEDALRKAAVPPFKIMKKCSELIEILETLVLAGNKLVISDTAVGALFCKSALHSADLNVLINTSMMKDRQYAESLEHETKGMLEAYSAKAEAVYTMALRTIVNNTVENNTG